MRITVNGQRAEIQIKRSVDISKWNSQKECAIGKERKSMELNHYLDTVRMKVLQIHSELEQIEGVGDKTVQTLLRHFRTVEKVRAANIEELSALVGAAKAKKIRAFFEK